jgi:hypothetical protein
MVVTSSQYTSGLDGMLTSHRDGVSLTSMLETCRFTELTRIPSVAVVVTLLNAYWTRKSPTVPKKARCGKGGARNARASAAEPCSWSRLV